MFYNLTALIEILSALLESIDYSGKVPSYSVPQFLYISRAKRFYQVKLLSFPYGLVTVASV